MWPIILLGLLTACLAGWLVTWQRQRNRIRQLERSKEEIQIEETLVFDFLHGLGEAFSETIRAADLNRLIVEGAANKEAADTLQISVRTVEKHRQRIMKKLGVHKATELVKFAITRGMVNLTV